MHPQQHYDHTIEFNRNFSIDFILKMNGFSPITSSSVIRHNSDKLYSEYRKPRCLIPLTISFSNRHHNEKPLCIFVPNTGHEIGGWNLYIDNAYDLYYRLNCQGDESLAANWRNNQNLFPQQNVINNHHAQLYLTQPIVPTFDLYEYFNKTETDYTIHLKSLMPDSLIRKMVNYFSEKNNIPESTLMLIGLGVFSGLTCRKWNCAYPDGEIAPICLYVVAEQDASSGKSSVLNAFQKPFVTMVEKEIEKIEAIILTQEEKLKAHLETEIDISKEDKQRFKIQTKKLKEELGNTRKRKIEVEHIMPKTNITPQALEESLNYTNGFFIAASDEQSLLDSLIAGKGNTSNEILLKGRNSERIQSVKISRKGYTGKVTGSFVCFAQSGSIAKIIKASGASGLCERFLMISEPEMMNKDHLKSIPDPSKLFTEYAEKFHFLKGLIEKPLNHNELITLQISSEGWNEINTFNNTLENLILPDGILSHQILKRMAKKSTLQIMSIASNLHLSECRYLPLLDGDYYIEDRFVYIAIEIMNGLLHSTRDYFERNGFMSSKEELRSIIDYFIGTNGEYKRVKVSVHALESRKKLGTGKRNLIRDNLNFLIKTYNLIGYEDGTTGLNPMVRL